MPGGLAYTLLALVWTQYQYLVFPIIRGWMACKLLFDDLYYTWFLRGSASKDPVVEALE